MTYSSLFSGEGIGSSSPGTSPWVPSIFTINAHAAYQMKYGKWQGERNKHVKQFLLLGLKVSPLESVDLEINTQNIGSLSLNARKQFLDDLLGDAIALTGLIGYTRAAHHAVKNPFYELFASNTFFLGLGVGRHLMIGHEPPHEGTYSQLFGDIHYAQPTAGKGAIGFSVGYVNHFRVDRELYITAAAWHGFGTHSFGIHGFGTRISTSRYRGLAYEHFKTLDISIGLKQEFTGVGTLELRLGSRIYARQALTLPISALLRFTWPISI